MSRCTYLKYIQLRVGQFNFVRVALIQTLNFKAKPRIVFCIKWTFLQCMRQVTRFASNKIERLAE